MYICPGCYVVIDIYLITTGFGLITTRYVIEMGTKPITSLRNITKWFNY